ncbi:MAG: ATP-binding protein [Candidatus Eisenbacteria bacterium]|nr:ATP-binding protein [Candidatus Eisenbacteria bacterium]
MGLYPVVVVMGARQVGKSTLCLELAAKHGLARRTLDDRDVRAQALADPEGFLDDLGENGAFIDEVQRAPDLLLAIKAVVDRDPRKGQYLLSGSSQPRVSKAVSDSLLGRATYRTLRPLTLSELRFDEEHPGWSFLFDTDEQILLRELEKRAESSGRLDWREVVQTGGFPRAVAAPPNQRLRILDDYVEIFSRRDVREIVSVESTSRLEAFVRLAAMRTGRELNISGMSSDLGVPVSTIRRWLDALQRSYLIELVPPYFRNASQRVIKSPKLYSVDAALSLAASRDTTATGFHLETLIAGDLFVWKDGDPTRDLYHWRLSSGQEVDFILEERGQLLPVEIKASNNVGAGDARHLATFRERHANTPRGVLVSCDPTIRVLKPGLVACPWWAII